MPDKIVPERAGSPEDVDIWDSDWEEIPKSVIAGKPSPLSAGQRRLWILDRLYGPSSTFNIPVCIWLRGRLDCDLLQETLAQIAGRHNILRSRLEVIDDRPYQVAGDVSGIELPILQFTSETSALAWAESEARKSFDLAGGGALFSAQLGRVDSGVHLLVLLFHHFVIDGWSISLLLNELSVLLSAKVAGVERELADLPIQYADYAAWQSDGARGTSCDAGLVYWKKHLRGLRTVELPADYARPAVQSTRGETLHFELPEDGSKRFLDLARKARVSPFMVAAAALQSLIARYTGETDIAIGSPVANRARTELQNLIGFFVNPIVLRTGLEGDPRFSQILERVRTVCVGAYAHQELPFDLLVEELRPERDLSRSPLFQVMLSFEMAPGSGLNLPGVSAEVFEVHTGTSKYDLTLTLNAGGGVISGVVEYNPELYERETVERLIGHYRGVLEAVSRDAGLRLSELPLLSAEERAARESWNRTEREFEFVPAIRRFERQAAENPEALAIDELAYGELNRRANRFAGYLRERGVGRESRVGIRLERSAEMVIAALGTWKAGGAYVPMDPGYPAERLRYMAEDAQVAVLVDAYDAEAYAGYPDTNLNEEIWPEQLAYVIYTSGSTGLPKGVGLPQGALANYLAWALDAYDVAGGEGSAVQSSLSFDLTVTSLYLPLLAGKRVRLVPPGEGEIDALAAMLREADNWSLLKLTPGHLEVLENLLGEEADLAGRVRCLVIGGEALTGGRLKYWRERLPGAALINEYGPTETVVGCCVYNAAQEQELKQELGAVPVGRAIANARIHILDAWGEPVPVGVPGEIYIGGAGIGRGYLDRVELTAERFVPDPFGRAGERLYRSGDRGRYRLDGVVEYLGRGDGQVKVRGYRVELGEVEAALESHPGVAHAAVALCEGRLIGYWTQRGVGVEAGELRSFLETRLPEYEVPSALVELAALPLTANGKVDRAALPQHELHPVTSTAPKTAVETLLSDIWAQAEVLGIEQLGIHDNFFDLGGHSLLATRVVSRVRQTFDIEMPLRSVFEAPTIAQLAQRVESALSGEERIAGTETIPVLERGGPLEVSYAQQRLWLLEQLAPGSAVYNVPLGLRFRGPLDVEAVERALVGLVERHEILRTRFVTVRNEVKQEVLPGNGGFRLERLRFPDGEWRTWAEREARRPFALDRGPLLRAGLAEVGAQDWILLLVLHHIAVDGWAVGILLREFAALYEAQAGGRAAGLSVLPVQYADYAAWQRKWLLGEVSDRQLGYWKRQLAGVTPLELPADHARGPVQGTAGATVTLEFPARLTQALQELSRRENATLFMTLLAAFEALLARYTGREDIALGSPITTRHRAEVEGLIGFFVNMLVLRTDLSGDPSFHETVERTRKTCLEAYAHQDVPFERLVEELQPERDLSRSPLFQVIFALQNAPEGKLALSGIEVEMETVETGTSKFDLNVSLSESGGVISGVVEYNPELYKRETVERLIGHYRGVLEAVSRDAGLRLSELPLLSAEERAARESWNRTEREFEFVPAIRRFERQAAENPEALAIDELAYGELNRRANRFAGYLRERGVGRESRVGIRLERSAEMVIAALGTWKAGGAYVPMDPGYPAERLRYMAEDAQVAVLVDAYDAEAYAGYPDTNLNEEIWPEQLAYVIYTSGSTGLPKGVGLPQGALANYLAWALDAYDVAGGEGSAVQSSLSFDLTVTSLYLPLLAGKRVRLVPPGEGEIDALAAMLREADNWSLLKLTPGHLEVLENLLGEEADLAGRVRCLVIGGEALTGGRLKYWRERLPGAALINEYGPTETVVGCCVYNAAQEQELKQELGAVPVGRAIANARIHILDAWGEPVPVGVPGEIYIGGAGIGRGYLDRVELTAERFVPDPFGRAGERLYRSGDRGRYRLDGVVEYLGRGDGQVKVRGYRVELGEVEAALESHPGVAHAAVALCEGRLIGYWTQRGVGVEAGELRSFLETRLPEYEVPSALVELAALPLTANGKVDRTALPQHELHPVTNTAPKTDLQQSVATIWEDILALPGGSLLLGDNFFELGGHSLLASRLIAQMRQELGIELPLRSIFEAATLEQFADLAQRVRDSSPRSETRIPRLSRPDRPSLSFAQRRLWFLDQLQPGNSAYNVPLAYRIIGSLDAEGLEGALTDLLARHETLRTGFVAQGGEPWQEVGRDARIALRQVDFSGAHDPEAEARAWSEEEARRPFQLDFPPLLRAGLAKLSASEWLFVLVFHHIAIDAWSLQILVRDLAALYGSRRRSSAPKLPSLPIQYADYAIWQVGRDAGIYTADLSYWTSRLEDLPPLEVPSDKQRIGVQGFVGEVFNFDLPEWLGPALSSVGRQDNATLFMVLLAGFESLLARYTGQVDFAVGTPVANRHFAEVQELIGFFVNTLVLRADLSGDPSFHEAVERTRKTCLEAYAHQDLPFERLVEELQPERDLSRSPLFQVMFAFQSVTGSELRLDGAQTEYVTLHNGTSKFDLNVSLSESGGVISGVVEYNPELYERETVERLIGHYRGVLEAVSRDAGLRLSELPLLSAEERAARESWNRTEREFEFVPAIRRFERQAAENPEALAIDELAYGELNRRANRFAGYLRERGVGRESRVGIRLERSAEMVIAALGTWKAGGAYVPMDPGYPAERLRYMAEDAQVAVLVDAYDAEAYAGYPDTNLNEEIWPEQLAYVIYTSGSTGLPKGVGLPQGALANYVAWALDAYDVAGGEGSAVQSSLSFDLTVTSLYLPLLAGKRVRLVPPGEGEIDALAAMLREADNWSLLKLTPGHLEVLENLLGEEADLAGRVRCLVIGGEALTGGRLKYWRERLPGTALINEYGPTETVVGCCVYNAAQEQELKQELGAVPVGRAIANARIHILDAWGEPVPVGVPGEIYIGGAGIGRGYLDRVELTAERFVPDPFGRAGERLYRSGDRGRYRLDGVVEYLGRGDGQVKVRGYRVELGEVEAALESHPGVAHAAVALCEGRLIGYWTQRGVGVEAGELRSFLETRLPEYEVPSALVELAALPLTANGKVDRAALPQHELHPVTSTAPKTAVETLLSDIWAQAEVLGIEQLGIHDNFFDLGGHSLLATRVVSRVRQTFDIEMPLRSVFEAPTIAQLAQRVESALSGEERIAGTETIPVLERGGPLEVSYAQQRLWLLEQLAPGSAVYNVPLGLRFRGPLDVEAVERALVGLVERHEILRTRFVTVRNEVKQEVLPGNGGFRLERLRFPDGEWRTWAEREARRPFALDRGPLLRAGLAEVGAQDWILLLVLHHIAVDGWAVGILLREFAALYEAQAGGRAAGLSVLPVQYADYAAWQRKWLLGEVSDRQLGYWKRQLAGVTPLELPADHARGPVQGTAGATVTLEFPARLTQALQELSRRENATLFMTLLAAFEALLARYTGREDIALGSPITTRHRAEVEGLIGFFVNMLVLRTDLSGDPSFHETVERTRKTCLEAYAHQDVPFERLVEELQPERDLSRSPLFQVIFALQNAPEGKLALSGIEVEMETVETGTSKFDLNVSLSESGGVISGVVEYNPELYKRETVERLIGHYRGVLEAVSRDAGLRLSELPLLSAEERAARESWNRTEREFEFVPAIRRFERQAAENPEALAIDELAYGELNRRANRFAGYLRERGVGRESRVGIRLERSAEMVIAALGTWKAGGAYVPMDPGYPAERLRYMAEDAQVAVLVDAYDAEAYAGYPDTNLNEEIWPEQLAYVIYTSGSTGLPKGVGLPQGALANYLAWALDAYDVAGGEGSAVQSSLSFDLTVTSLYLPLLAGKRVRLVPPGEGEIDALAAMLREADNWSLLKLTPGHLEVLENLLGEEADLAGRVRCLVIGGEALTGGRLKYWRERLPGAALINEYGPTETVVGCCVYNAAQEQELKQELGAVPVGRAIANARIHILDAWGEPVPVGVPGEIYIGGAGIGRGYLDRVELTAERFVPDPFGRAGERLYRSGDRGRYRLDGVVEYLGRGDGQVKVRGYRVELGEVEAALESHAGVAHAAVALCEGRLIGYWTQRGVGVEAGELRAFLETRLPEYEVPSALVELAALPLTANGKVDRAALPQHELHPVTSTAPKTAVETLLSDIWAQAEVLGIEQLGIHDNFFDLGGHSLLATRVVSRVRQTFDIEMPLRSVFEAPTIAQLALRVESALSGEGGKALRPIVKAESSTDPPLSYAQQRLWLLEQLTPGTASYNVPLGIRLDGNFDAAATEIALQQIIARHATLRTRFISEDGGPVQIIEPSVEWALDSLDFSHTPQPEADALQWAAEAIQRPFSLDAAPLIRVTALRVSERTTLLIFVMHHIVLDGWSVAILLREFQALYRHALLGEASELSNLPIQYADYAVWQRSWMAGEVYATQLDYWRRQLAGLRPLDLAADHNRPAVQSFEGGVWRIAFPSQLARDLHRVSREQGATLFMTLLSSFMALLTEYSSSKDLAVGTPISNRNRVEIEGLIGFFVNTLVLRGDLNGDPTFADLLAQIRKTCLDAYAHQDLPFERLVEEIHPFRDLSRSPLFQVMFSLNDTSDSGLSLPGLAASFIPLHTGSVKFDLNLHLSENAGEISGVLEYNASLFHEATVERMAQRYLILLNAFAADPGKSLSKIVAQHSRSAAHEEPLAANQHAEATREFYSPELQDIHVLLEQIWSGVLNIPVADAGANFFELGGHSLLASRVVARIRKVFRVELPLSAVFEHPTVAKLARRIQSCLIQGVSVEQDPIVPVSDSAPLPLSYSQQRLWFLHQLDPNGFTYNVPIAIRLSGQLNELALVQSLDAIVERHAVLRTKFILGDEEPMQEVTPAATVDLQKVDFTSSVNPPDAAAIWVEKISRLPFDLGQPKLFRPFLARVSRNENWLLLVMHHIVTDGWSTAILLSELAALYEAAIAGKRSPLAPLQIQYGDFAVWQQRVGRRNLLANLAAYWRQQLANLPHTEIEPDHPRPAVQTYSGAVESFEWSEELSGRIHGLCRRNGVTMHMALLAAFKVLLSKYTGQIDLVVGTTVANRTRTDLEGLIGFFVNTLVLRTDLSGDPQFTELLQRERKVCLDAYAHEEFPFEKLVEELHPERNLSYSPLFQILFQYQNAPEAGTEFADLKAEQLPAGSGTAKFDLHLAVGERDGRIAGGLEYNTGLFEHATIVRLLHHFRNVVDQLSVSPETRISGVHLLTGAERAQLVRWNNTECEWVGDRTLAALFEQQVRRTPSSTALIFGGKQTTFGDLNSSANRLARQLRKKGTQPEDRIGVCLERSVDAVTAMLAVLKCGAAYVPLDPELPPERLNLMISDAELKFVVTRKAHIGRISTSVPTICLDRDKGQIAKAAASNLGVPVDASQTAYLIFTSGSTGTPKAVAGLHGATVNRLNWMADHYPFSADEVCCAKASINFVDSVAEIFAPLLRGVPLAILSTDEASDTTTFMRVLRDARVTRLVLVPSLLRVFLDEHARGRLDLPSLRYWILSGEALPGLLAKRLLANAPGSVLLNLYGSSEDAADVMYHELAAEDEGTLVPIGKPIANTSVFVLDPNLDHTPPGVAGGIYVSGGSLARGYWNRAAETAERFIPDPFSAKSGARMYRTGDLGKRLPNGDVVYGGRSDDQIKIRGNRVGLREVENAIEKHPSVQQAVVVNLEQGGEGEQTLAAYLLWKNGADSVDEIRSFTRKLLPGYMVPSLFLAVDKFPRTASGKVDRKALPSPSKSVAEPAGIPETLLEFDIADIWKKLLNVETVGLDDNFFDLGGHSLQLVRLRSELRYAIGRDLPVLDLFTYSTVRSLARYISRGNADSALLDGIVRRAALRRHYFEHTKKQVVENRSSKGV